MSKTSSGKNPYALFLLSESAQKYFNQRRHIFLTGAQTPNIKRVDIWMLRADHRSQKKSFVAIYDLYAGRRPRRRVVGLAHQDGSRAVEHGVVTRLTEVMDEHPALCIPRPVHFDKKYNVSFIEHVPGRVLNDILGEKGTLKTPILHSLIDWLTTLQQVDPTSLRLPHRRPDFRPFLTNLKTATTLAPEFAPKLQRLWKRFDTWYHKEEQHMPHVLAHGDFHPWNIKVLPGTNQISVYDFGLVTRAPRHWDLASFLAQIESINNVWLPIKRIRTIQEDVLATWCTRVSPLTKQELGEIKRLKGYFDLSAIVYLIAWGEPWKDYERITSLYDQLS